MDSRGADALYDGLDGTCCAGSIAGSERSHQPGAKAVDVPSQSSQLGFEVGSSPLS